MKTVTCTDKDSNLYEVLASDLSWRPSVYAIIVQDAKILLVPQWDGHDLPGGGIELGETLEEGLVREVKEETGLDIKIDAIVDTRTNFYKSLSGKFIHSILLYFTATVTGGELSTDGFAEAEKEYAKLAEWVPLSEIPNIKFYSSVELLPIINKAIQQ